jgi:hypothetical protein
VPGGLTGPVLNETAKYDYGLRATWTTDGLHCNYGLVISSERAPTSESKHFQIKRRDVMDLKVGPGTKAEWPKVVGCNLASTSESAIPVPGEINTGTWLSKMV